MTNGINSSQAKWLTYLVYFLLSLLTIVLAFTTYQQSVAQAEIKALRLVCDSIPEKYVRLERYKADIDRTEKLLQCISVKLDRMIERETERKK